MRRTLLPVVGVRILDVHVTDCITVQIWSFSEQLTALEGSFLERVMVVIYSIIALELATFTLVIVDLEMDLPRRHVLAVLVCHPREATSHLEHRHVLQVQFFASEEHLVVRVQVWVINHIGHPKLLPGLVELDFLLASLVLPYVVLDVVEIVGRLVRVANHTGFGHNLEICDAVDATLPCNDVVIPGERVLVIEITHMRDHRSDALPRHAVLAFEHLRELALLHPVV